MMQRGVKTEMSVTAFAERLGKSEGLVRQSIKAASVFEKFRSQLRNDATNPDTLSQCGADDARMVE